MWMVLVNKNKYKIVDNFSQLLLLFIFKIENSNFYIKMYKLLHKKKKNMNNLSYVAKIIFKTLKFEIVNFKKKNIS